ncbi:hypothetical protein VTL71DRAFT_15250 [Oculimacula yallundae]|uniref:Uncharacterized protein n=1 Tax=Oculimacula yallundae TaxID=86028 RepID=A0ABR4CHC4_9HELO
MARSKFQARLEDTASLLLTSPLLSSIARSTFSLAASNTLSCSPTVTGRVSTR